MAEGTPEESYSRDTPTPTLPGDKHALEHDTEYERDAKRPKLEDDDIAASPHTHGTHYGAPSRSASESGTGINDAAAHSSLPTFDDGEGESEHDPEPEDDEHDHDFEDHTAAPSSRASPDKDKAKKGEKKKRVRTEKDRERDRERRRERDRARRAREKAEREEAAAQESVEPRRTDATDKGEVEDLGEDIELYCVCKGANGEEGGTMVGCETCDNWFHPACVGINEEQVDMLDVYICEACEATITRRTSYRRVCKNGCGRAARDSSKFCSSRCAFAHARSVLAGVDKKDTKELEKALAAYPSPSPSVMVERGELANGSVATEEQRQEEQRKTAEKDRKVVAASQDTSTMALVSSLRRQSADVERALEIVARRQAILAAAVAAWEALAPVAPAEEPKKKAKNRRRDGAEKDPRPCGYDSRIAWSDAEVQAWDGEEREAPAPPTADDGEDEPESPLEQAARLGLCTAGRRCERHQGWQKTFAVALDVETAQLARRRDDLAALAERVEKVAEMTVTARQARDVLHGSIAQKPADSQAT